MIFRRHSRLCQEKAGKKVPIENKKAESMKAQNRKNYVRFNDQLGVNALDETLSLGNFQARSESSENSFSSNGFALSVCPEPSKKNFKQALKNRNYFITGACQNHFSSDVL